MDMERYKKQFFSEARDYLDSINDCLLVLEKNPDDQENIDKCFRSIHTLKGNSATMGFKVFSELSHELEDILSKIRDGELVLDEDIIEVLFHGLDLLEDGIDLIKKGKPEELDISKQKNLINKILHKEDSSKKSIKLEESDEW